MSRAAVEQLRKQSEEVELSQFLPQSLQTLADPQKDIPRIAKDETLTAQIEQVLPSIPTVHHLFREDARRMELPSESVHLVVTSPPYWGLRDYGCDGQIGLEDSPVKYIATMREVFAEVRRVLRSDGTLWLNMGDSYSGSWGNLSPELATGKARPAAKGDYAVESARVLESRILAADR